jgi:hypothetical protein
VEDIVHGGSVGFADVIENLIIATLMEHLQFLL